MNRRIFIRNSVLGACSLGLPATGLPASLWLPGNAMQWLRRLRSELDLRPGTAPTAAATVVEAIAENFGRRGYQRSGRTVYFYGDTSEWFLYPLELRHAQTGVLDVALAALHRQPDGSWQHALTLNGFQLEALCHVAATLPVETDGSLADRLLPAGSWRGLAYPTRRGAVEVHARLRASGDTAVHVVVRDNAVGAPACDLTFASRHALMAGVAAV